MTLYASLARDAIVWIGIPALLYAAVLGLGIWVLGKRVGPGSARSFGVPALLGVGLIALSLGLFAGIGAKLVTGGDAVSDAFVGWGRMVIVGLYAVSAVSAILVGRRVARRSGVDVTKYVAAAATAVFFFVIVSAPFSSYVNACHLGDSIIINTAVNCP